MSEKGEQYEYYVILTDWITEIVLPKKDPFLPGILSLIILN